MKKNIYKFVNINLLIINLKIIFKVFLNLIKLYKTRNFLIYKSIKFVIIDKNKNLIFTVF